MMKQSWNENVHKPENGKHFKAIWFTHAFKFLFIAFFQAQTCHLLEFTLLESYINKWKQSCGERGKVRAEVRSPLLSLEKVRAESKEKKRSLWAFNCLWEGREMSARRGWGSSATFWQALSWSHPGQISTCIIPCNRDGRRKFPILRFLA